MSIHFLSIKLTFGNVNFHNIPSKRHLIEDIKLRLMLVVFSPRRSDLLCCAAADARIWDLCETVYTWVQADRQMELLTAESSEQNALSAVLVKPKEQRPPFLSY